MEDFDFAKQEHAYSGAFSLIDFGPQRNEQSFNICPPDAAGNWPRKNLREGGCVFAFHEDMILFFDIMSRRLIKLVASGIPLPRIAPAGRGIEKHLGLGEERVDNKQSRYLRYTVFAYTGDMGRFKG